MTEKAKYSNRSEVFLSLSEHLRKTIDWAEVFSAEESIAVKYNSLDIPYIDVIRIIQSQLKEFTYQEESVQKYLLSIPDCYSGEFGLDIEEVGAKHTLSNQEIADLHSGVTYKVKMIGFTPGFAYLGDLPNKLVMPRLSTPRINLLPGSVGISGNRTGVYTLGGPGGWRIIGRTPLKLFDPDKYKELADLPTKEELLSKLVGGLSYPMNTLASTLNSLIPKFLTALNEINKQKK